MRIKFIVSAAKYWSSANSDGPGTWYSLYVVVDKKMLSSSAADKMPFPVSGPFVCARTKHTPDMEEA